ncbi:MAG TPA: hypothetical protein VKZ49_09170 [Polyangiaceae bacterium]|nr:hypothetical protein [Polyangiaceae bacterium]
MRPMRNTAAITLLAWLFVIGPGTLTALPACKTSCAEGGQEAIVYSGGQVTGNVYASTPWNDAWLHFPSERVYKFKHGLGTENVTPLAYLSFDPRPTGGEGNAAPASGNELVVEEITAEYVQVRNDTCAEFYLLMRIEAVDPATPASDPTGGVPPRAN